MSDLIDREAALYVIEERRNLIGMSEDVERGYMAALDAVEATVRSLPAAVPVVDVEKAAETYRAGRVISRGSTDEEKVAAILSAGYAGSVSVEDIRIMCSPLATTEEHMDARKRLLAAIEGK